jgi:hypothetical protein
MQMRHYLDVIAVLTYAIVVLKDVMAVLADAIAARTIGFARTIARGRTDRFAHRVVQ